MLLLAAPLTVGIFLGEYTPITWMNAVTGWIYPFLQPVSRALTGVWLWQLAAERGAPGDS